MLPEKMQTGPAINHCGLTLTAVGLMDTVSQIRGKIGRPALPEKDKFYFMKKKETLSTGGKIQGQMGVPFAFTIEATEPDRKLMDG